VAEDKVSGAMALPPLHGSVDALAWYCYELKLSVVWSKAVGLELQHFFSRVMSKTHGGQFCQSLAWGAEGDHSCDGYLSDSRHLFAVYAPEDFHPLSKAIKKIRGDHSGALKKWREILDRWTLVHNLTRDQLPAKVIKLLAEFAKKEPKVGFDHWGFENTRHAVRVLSYDDLADLLGEVPRPRDFRTLPQEDILLLIGELAPLIEQLPVDDDVRPVPAAKAEFNRLSVATITLLNAGARFSPLVQRAFDRHPDPRLGERTVAALSKRYNELKSQHHADDIFSELVNGMVSHRTLPNNRAYVATLAVLAYLFEACHIFERPPVEAQ